MIAVRPFSIHPNRSTEVKVRMIIDNFRIDLCPFNIIELIRNTLQKNFVFHIVKKFRLTSKTAKSRLGNKSTFLCTTLKDIANKIDHYLRFLA